MTEHAGVHKTTTTTASHAPVAPEGPASVLAPVPAVGVLGQNPDKSYVKTLVLSALFGYFGVDRFYLNKVGTGVAKLLTFGGLGIWVLVDFIITLVGAAREKDKPNLELHDTQKYKPFFVKITLVCVAIYVAIIALEIVLFAVLATLGTQFQQNDSVNPAQTTQLDCRDTIRNIDLPAEACQGQTQNDSMYDAAPTLRQN